LSCYRDFQAEEKEEERRKKAFLKEVERVKVELEGGKLAELLAELNLYKQPKY
jgi:hypothetical protein